MLKLDIPRQVCEVIEKLNNYNFKACVVGECVRDLIINEMPLDFDVVTNASIDDILDIFREYKTLNDKIASGELFVIIQGVVIGVSSYRELILPDGKPIYAQRLTDDLARRDFSINAIAYDLEYGIIDPYNGVSCLESEPWTISVTAQEFEHDEEKEPYTELVTSFDKQPYYILKALAYYSTGRHVIAEQTKKLILENVDRLKELSPSIITKELDKIILGKRISIVLQEYFNVFAAIIPEMIPLLGFLQHSKSQDFELWEHTYRSVGYSTPDLALRYALLFHALGKPDCYGISGAPYATYFGHAERARLLSAKIMKRLNFNCDVMEEVNFLIQNHDYKISEDPADLRFLLKDMTPLEAKKLLLFNVAHQKGKSPNFEQLSNTYKRLSEQITNFYI